MCVLSGLCVLSGCASLQEAAPASEVTETQTIPATQAVASGVKESGVDGRPLSLILDEEGQTFGSEMSSQIRTQFDQVWQHMAAGELQVAKHRLAELQRSHPHFSGVYTNLAIIAYRENNTAEASALVKQALDRNPNNEDALVLRGILLREKGDVLGAEAHYMSALKRLPESTSLRLNLGMLQELYLGKLGDALAHYERYHARVPEDQQVAGWIIDVKRRLPDQETAP